MRISTEVKGPSLADVLAFTILEKEEDVARVERAARRRLRGVSEWEGWRIFSTETHDQGDEIMRLNVFVEPTDRSSPSALRVFDFYLGIDGRHSARFAAFIRAVGIVEKIEDDRELVGRYFATLNDGRTGADFGPLTRSIV